MTIRSIPCPACSVTVNVPAAMANVRCPKCGHVWNAHQPVATNPEPVSAAGSKTTSSKSTASKSGAPPAVAIVGLIIGGMLVMGLLGIVVLRGWNPSSPDDATATTENTASVEPASDETVAPTPTEPEPYRIVDVSEAKRRKIYDDCCAARSATQNQLRLPSGSFVQESFDGMMDQILERELKRFAAIHDVRLEDMYEIMKEGDAKNWRGDQASN